MQSLEVDVDQGDPWDLLRPDTISGEAGASKALGRLNLLPDRLQP